MLITFRVRARPALAAALSALCLTATPALAQSQACPGADTVPTSASIQSAKATTLCLVNEQRAAAGLVALHAEPSLERVADSYSLAMVAQRIFEHVLPDGRTLAQRATDYTTGGDNWTLGENIAYGEAVLATPRATMVAWMNSAGHRANILDPGYRDVGIGIAIGTPVGSIGPASTYTTDFGSRELSPITAAAASTVATSSKPRVTRRSCTRAVMSRLTTGSRRTRTSACARLRRAALRKAALRAAAR